MRKKKEVKRIGWKIIAAYVLAIIIFLAIVAKFEKKKEPVDEIKAATTETNGTNAAD